MADRFNSERFSILERIVLRTALMRYAEWREELIEGNPSDHMDQQDWQDKASAAFRMVNELES